VLYTLALHRLLKVRLANYDYEQHMGGAVYIFMRGIHQSGSGVHFQRPPLVLIETLDSLFAGITA
jgi:exodeoxyribonuclease V beta subunit